MKEIKKLYEEVGNLLRINVSQATELNKKALELCSKDCDKEMYYKLLIQNAFIIGIQGNNFEAIKLLKTIIQETKDDSELKQINNSATFSLAREHFLIGKNNTARNLLEKLIEENPQNATNQNLYGIYLTLGAIYQSENKLLEAYETFLQARYYAETYDLPPEVANSNVWLGVVTANMEDVNSALNYYLLAKDYYEKANDTSGLGNVYNSLGLLMLRTEDYDKSEVYLKKANETYLQLKSNEKLADVYSNLGLLHYHKKEYKKALEFDIKSLELRKSNHTHHLFITHSQILNIYIQLEDWEKSYNQCKKCLKFYKELYPNNNNFEFELTLLKITFKLQKMIEFQSTYKLLLKNLPSFNQSMQKKFYETMAFIYEKKQKYKKAYFAMQKVREISLIEHKEILKLKSSLANNKLEIHEKIQSLKEEKRINAELKDLNQKLINAQNEILELEKKNSVLAMGVTLNHEIR